MREMTMHDNGVLFKTLTINGTPLSECELMHKTVSYRLYVDTNKELNSFNAMAIEFVSCSTTSPAIWDCPELRVDQLFRVTAYHDGVRHLEFNRESDMPGYIYYPNMQDLISLFEKVREIELKICRDCDQ